MSKAPWETPEGKEVWKSEAKYWGWLRGSLRRLWSDYPLRKVWKKSQLRPVTKQEREDKVYHTSTKNVGQCSFCHVWMAGSKLECDHLIESDGCTSKETAESFLWHCGGLIGEDFRLACKPCHKIQSYSQRSGLDFKEASAEKEAIAICKAKEDKQWLSDKGLTPATSAPKRRIQIVQYLKENSNGSTNTL